MPPCRSIWSRTAASTAAASLSDRRDSTTRDATPGAWGAAGVRGAAAAAGPNRVAATATNAAAAGYRARRVFPARERGAVGGKRVLCFVFGRAKVRPPCAEVLPRDCNHSGGYSDSRVSCACFANNGGPPMKPRAVPSVAVLAACFGRPCPAAVADEDLTPARAAVAAAAGEPSQEPKVDEAALVILKRATDAIFALDRYQAESGLRSQSLAPRRRQSRRRARARDATLMAVKPNLMRYDSVADARPAGAAGGVHCLATRQLTPTYTFVWTARPLGASPVTPTAQTIARNPIHLQPPPFRNPGPGSITRSTPRT
jgi:hypothetical protein